MHLKTDDKELDAKKTVKLQLRKRQLLRLKSLKILTGTDMSSIAGEALEEFFDKRGHNGEVHTEAGP